MSYYPENSHTVKISEDRIKERREVAAEKLIKGYKLNSYPNRRARRYSAKMAGYLPHGWLRYKASTNPQTYIKAA